MSGFSTQWLSLREPADLRARNAKLREAVVALMAQLGHAPRIVDLGCGTGSNLRALAPYLGAAQTWRLIDHDPALLAAARTALSTWADGASASHDGIRLQRQGQQIDVQFAAADLAGSLDGIFEQGADLVTATAFFDLVSTAWIGRFVDALVARNLPLYAVLTYDGREEWSPPHAQDAAVLAAFNLHQASDKGFGPAAGPRAAAVLRDCFEARGWHVTTGDSAWRLDVADAELMAPLAQGIADAAGETGDVSPADVAAWSAARIAASACLIGHVDLFATPVSLTPAA